MSHRDGIIKKNKELSKPMDLFNVGFVGTVGGSKALDVTSGGNLTTYGSYSVRTFLSSANAVVEGEGDMEVFLVAGAGGGSQNSCGGGGGAIIKSNVFTIVGGTYPVVVGGGGSGTNTGTGATGSDSTFNSISVDGGIGGSGVGGDCGTGTFPAGITGTIYGNNTGNCARSGGAGAGANGNCGSAPTAGNGGDGIQLTNWDGTSYWYSGGGGSGTMSNYYTWKNAGHGVHSSGGGGAGHYAHGAAGNYQLGSGGSGGRNSGGNGGFLRGGNGGSNTGSGAGGGGYGTMQDGNGGSGIVILRWLTP